ncbi:S1C family serine protease [Propionibacteriaceae bacterium G1746]
MSTNEYPNQQNHPNNPNQQPNQPIPPHFVAPNTQHSWPAAAPTSYSMNQQPFVQQQPATTQTTTPTKSPKPLRRITDIAVAAVLAAALAVGGTTLVLDRTSSSATGTTTAVVTQKVAVDGGTKTADPDWTTIAANVSASVVSINVTTQQGSGAGSGVVWDTAGHIVTNNHVVSGATTVEVTMADQVTYAAKVVATDPVTDLAVIQLENPPKDLTPITQQKTEPKVGDPVMAIGNPLGLSGTVTTGIISAVDRPVVSSGEAGSTASVTLALQTSAAINPGNSGGALVDADGSLVGINSSIATLSQGQSQSGSIGIGFAIPTAQVASVVDQLISSGRAAHAALGIAVTDGTADLGSTALTGAKVAQLQSGGAAEGKLQAGDVVTAVDNERVASAAALIGVIRSMQVGNTVQLTVYRSGSSSPTSVSVTLGDANK